jgi:glycosyltransferase involved in cell wall biosynthesis
MATYNGEKYLFDQISSILIQLGPHDKLFISDDGSTDATLEIISSFGSALEIINVSRVGSIVKNFEIVLTHAFKFGADNIILSDQDDVWLMGRINLIKMLLNDHSMIILNGEVVDSNLQPIKKDIFEYVNFRSGFLNTLISTKYVGCCMAFRSEILRVALPFPKNILWHDWYLALVSQLFYKCGFSTKKTLLFRRHQNNASNTGERSRRNLSQKILSRVWISRAILIAIYRYTVLKLFSKFL